MKGAFLTALAAILLLPGMASAGNAPMQQLTLNEARRIALENHPLIKASDYETRAAEESIAATRSDYYPQVSGNAIRAFADINTRFAATGGLNNPRVIDRGSAGIGVSQLITDFGRTDALVEASQSAFEAKRQRAELSRAAVILGVTRAYYDALRAQALVKVARDTLKTRQTLLNQVASLRDVQMKSDLDLSVAKQGMDDANLLMLKAQNNRSDAMAELSEALGYSETRVFTLADDNKASPPKGSLESLLGIALSNNPELANLQSDYEAAQKEANAADAEFYPTVSAVGFAGGTPIRRADQPINRTYAAGGINLSIPIFTADSRCRQSQSQGQRRPDAGRNQKEYIKPRYSYSIRQCGDGLQEYCRE